MEIGRRYAMKSNFNMGLEILQKAQEESLYNGLLAQIQKDFARANVDLKVTDATNPVELTNILREKIYVLLLEKFEQYLNLLYTIDIPETEMKQILPLDAVDAATEVCFLIVKREWQKVWNKHKYNS